MSFTLHNSRDRTISFENMLDPAADFRVYNMIMGLKKRILRPVVRK